MEYSGRYKGVLFPEGIVRSFCWLKYQCTTHDGITHEITTVLIDHEAQLL